MIAFGQSNVASNPKDGVVGEDHNVVSEAEVRNLVPGTVAKRRGYRVPDKSGRYLVRFRNVVFFEFGDGPTAALGENSSYSTTDPYAFERVAERRFAPSVPRVSDRAVDPSAMTKRQVLYPGSRAAAGAASRGR